MNYGYGDIVMSSLLTLSFCYFLTIITRLFICLLPYEFARLSSTILSQTTKAVQHIRYISYDVH